jgi:hypothetical protein
MKRARNITIVGLLHDPDTLGRTIETLQAAGFPGPDISAATPRSESTMKLAHEHHTKAPEGATIGTAIGGLIVAGLGVLVGFGLLPIPGLERLVAAGPIVSAFTGLGAGGVIGWIIGALVGARIPEYEAKRYESFLSRGGILISAHCRDAAAERRARAILDGFGATGIDDMRESEPRHRRVQAHAA